MKKLLLKLYYKIKVICIRNTRKQIEIAKDVIVRKDAKIKSYGATIVLQSEVILEAHTRLVAQDGGKLIVNSNVYFNEGCKIVVRDRVEIGNNTLFGPGVYVYDHNHGFNYDGVEVNDFTTSPVVIEENCWIGAGAIILKGCHIGVGSIIGAGVVVRSDIPAHSVVTSNMELSVKPINLNN